MDFIKYIGGAIAIRFLMSGATAVLSEKLIVNPLPLSQANFKVVIRDSKVVGIFSPKLEVINRFGFAITVQSLYLEARQQGQLLSQIQTPNLVTIQNAESKILSVDMAIGANDFLDRINTLLEGNNASALSDINISGSLTLTNGVSFPISTTLKFISVG